MAQVITLTRTTATPWAVPGQSSNPVVLSYLAESFIFNGQVSYGPGDRSQLFPWSSSSGFDRRSKGLAVQGFLEGMWVRIINANSPDGASTPRWRYQLIRGDKFKEVKARIDRRHHQWLGHHAERDVAWRCYADVEVVVIAPTATFTLGNFYQPQQENRAGAPTRTMSSRRPAKALRSSRSPCTCSRSCGVRSPSKAARMELIVDQRAKRTLI